MSAWMVSRAHVDCLVTAAIVLDVIDADAADTVGEMLERENVRSLAYRYTDQAREGAHEMGQPPAGSYTFTPFQVEDPAFVLKELGCYDYQACECPDYRDSCAHMFVDALTAAILDALGVTMDEATVLDGYCNAPWGVDSRDEVA